MMVGLVTSIVKKRTLIHFSRNKHLPHTYSWRTTAAGYRVFVKNNTRTNPKAREIRIGGIVGLVVSFYQAGDDPSLLLIQSWLHRLAGCLLLLPLHYHFLFPLNLLICQYNCNRGWKGLKHVERKEIMIIYAKSNGIKK